MLSSQRNDYNYISETTRSRNLTKKKKVKVQIIAGYCLVEPCGKESIASETRTLVIITNYFFNFVLQSSLQHCCCHFKQKYDELISCLLAVINQRTTLCFRTSKFWVEASCAKIMSNFHSRSSLICS